VWHWSGALQVMATPAVQTPALQTSVWVQLLLSLQLVLSGLAGLEHWPVVGEQVPATWHWSGVGQVTGLAPTQVPFAHVSVFVQALPSSHGVPVFGVHVPVLGAQVVQA
jgi:hypothetical protein